MLSTALTLNLRALDEMSKAVVPATAAFAKFARLTNPRFPKKLRGLRHYERRMAWVRRHRPSTGRRFCQVRRASIRIVHEPGVTEHRFLRAVAHRYLRVFDADTGEDLTERIPVGYAGTIWHAKPGDKVTLTAYLLNADGSKYVIRHSRKDVELATEKILAHVAEVEHTV